MLNAVFPIVGNIACHWTIEIAEIAIKRKKLFGVRFLTDSVVIRFYKPTEIYENIYRDMIALVYYV